MGYLKLLATHPRTLAFGLLHSFFSGLGQTHFVSLFSPLLMERFLLSNTQYGSLYSLVTLASGLIIPFIGPQLDKRDARWLGVSIGIGLIICELLVVHSFHLLLLAVGLFGLRLFGQGLCSTLSSIVIARYFTAERGRALSLTALGFPIYEGLMTPLFAFLLVAIGLQNVGYILIAAVALIFIPLNATLTAKIPDFNLPPPEPDDIPLKEGVIHQHSHWTRQQVFKNKTIYLLLPQALMPPFALTGVFFHQAAIGEMKSWSLSLMASGLMFFALGRTLTTFVTGPLVDKYKAKTLFPFYQIPLTLAFLILGFGTSTITPAVSFALCGFAVGSGGPIKSAIWAELYGLRHLGAIKSAFATIMVLSTAASPALFGWLLDSFKEPYTLLYSLFFASIFSSFISYIGIKNH